MFKREREKRKGEIERMCVRVCETDTERWRESAKKDGKRQDGVSMR